MGVRVWVWATRKKEKLKNEGTFMTWKKVIWEKIFFIEFGSRWVPPNHKFRQKNLISVTTNEKTFHQIFLTKKKIFFGPQLLSTLF